MIPRLTFTFPTVALFEGFVSPFLEAVGLFCTHPDKSFNQEIG